MLIDPHPCHADQPPPEIVRLIGAGALEEAVAALEALMAGAGGDGGLTIRCLLLKSNGCVECGSLEDGLAAALQAGALAVEAGLRAEEAAALCLQAEIYLAGGLSAVAMDCATRALALAQTLGDAGLESRALLRMAWLALDTDDEAHGRQLIERSLVLAEVAGQQDDLFWAVNELSSIQGVEAARLAEQGNGALLPEAVAVMQETVGRALALAGPDGPWFQRAYATANLAETHILLGQHDQARALLAEYAALAERQGNGRLLAYANLHEARMLRAEGRARAAIDLLSSDMHRARLGSYADLTFATTEASVLLYKELGDFKSALHHMEQMRVQERAMMQRRAEQQLRLFVAKSDLERAREAEERLRTEAERLAVKAQMMEVERDALRNRSRMDGLTGVGNRHAAEEDLATRLAAPVAAGLMVVFVDVDNFKMVNDRFGHEIGDRVLQAVGQVIRAALPWGDQVYRIGGDEFILLVNEDSKAAAGALCEGLCRDIARFDWAELSPGLQVTASFGVADWSGEVQVNGFLARADAAMYQAKRAGRNRVFVDWAKG